jgi:hypothetical protein
MGTPVNIPGEVHSQDNTIPTSNFFLPEVYAYMKIIT